MVLGKFVPVAQELSEVALELIIGLLEVHHAFEQMRLEIALDVSLELEQVFEWVASFEDGMVGLVLVVVDLALEVMALVQTLLVRT